MGAFPDGWISVGAKKDYIVNVVDNVLVALFAIIGDGLAPFPGCRYLSYEFHRPLPSQNAYKTEEDWPSGAGWIAMIYLINAKKCQACGVDLESGVVRKFTRSFVRLIPKKFAPENEPRPCR